MGLQNTKNMWRENVLAYAHLGAEVHKYRILESQDGTTSIKY